MNVLVKDLRKYVPSLAHGYIHRYVKAIDRYRLINGALHKIFSLQTVKDTMKERRVHIMTSPKLPNKSRIEALINIDLVEKAIEEFENDTRRI